MSLDLSMFGSRVLGVFAHPDDEVFCAGTLRASLEAGKTVELLYLHSTPVRAQENQCAVRLLGLKPGQVRYYSAPDGNFHRELASIIQTLRSEFDRFEPDTVLVPAFEQGHPDHDSLNFAVRKAFDGQVLETPLYGPYCKRVQLMGCFGDQREAVTFHMGDTVLLLKSRMLSCYLSQSLKQWWALYRLKEGALRGKAQLGSVEYWAEVQKSRDYSEPMVPARLKEVVRHSPKWLEWRSAVNELIVPPAKNQNHV
ncbi:MAG: PIG-L deacetylase family protein [Fimbriimonadaceae bacterium]